MAVQNTGNATVFFDDQIDSTESDNLISAQIDPSQPQVKGLSTTTDPLVADRHLSKRMAAFDPEQFDLSDTSTLMRIMTAFISGAGIGGVRRQEIISRMGVSLSGTNFIELDGFWGSIFSLNRAEDETLPANGDGNAIDPSVDVADSPTWDQVQSRDGKYRSRIEQLAAGFARGATYDGMSLAARAILNCEVEVVESWLLADYATSGSVGFVGNTWQAIQLQYGTWGNLNNVSWGTLALGGTDKNTDTQAPLGNRGEVTIIPGRDITQAERYQLHTVLNQLAPAGMMVTISPKSFVTQTEVTCRSVEADSVDWDIVSYVNAQQGIDTNTVNLYPGTNPAESSRPAMSAYTGEAWTINSRIASVDCYAEDAFGNTLTAVDYQTVTFVDHTSHDYLPGDSVLDSRQLALARAATEGVAVNFPYARGRFSS